MSTPSIEMYEAAEALLLLKHNELDSITKSSIKQVKMIAQADDKATAVWNQWGPDLLGWKTLMESAKSPLHRKFYEQMYQRNAYLFNQEMAKARNSST